MTCLAYDGPTLAADSLQCWGSEPSPVNNTKIRPISHAGRRFLVGFAGNEAQGAALLQHWLNPARRLAGISRPYVNAGDNPASLIVVELILPTPRVFVIDEAGGEVEMEGHPTSVGSGGKYALGAMYAGADAEAAVRIAMKCDLHTGGKVQVERIAAWLNRTDPKAYTPLLEHAGA